MTTIIELKKENVWQEVKKTLAEVWSRSKGAELERLKQLIESKLGITTKWKVQDFHNKVYLLKFEDLPDEIEELLDKFDEFLDAYSYIALLYAEDIEQYRDDNHLGHLVKGIRYVLDLDPADPKLFIIPILPLGEDIMIALVMKEWT